jgi:hypothetical protein
MQESYLTNYLETFLFIRIKLSTRNIINIRIMNLTRFSDFLQALHIKWRHCTKNEYFSKQIQITTFYLLQKRD